MKINTKHLLPLVVTLASISLAGAAPTHFGAEPADATGEHDFTRIDNGVYPPPTAVEAANAKESANRYPDASMPAKSDRATGLIGMTVRNQNDQSLGKIKDIVFDMKSDRVAYVVLSARGTGTLGFKEKLLAVPLTAFTCSADNKSLVLQADKDKISSAAGIAGNWPSATSPSWGAQPFWQTDQETDQSRNDVRTDKSIQVQNPNYKDSSDDQSNQKLQSPRATDEQP